MTDTEKRETLVALAERVMGGRQLFAFNDLDNGHYHYKYELPDGQWIYIDARMSHPKPWNPLESIADAWMLVEALMRRGFHVECGDRDAQKTVEYYAVIYPDGTEVQYAPFRVGDTMPEAICLAALDATK